MGGVLITFASEGWSVERGQRERLSSGGRGLGYRERGLGSADGRLFYSL